MLRIVADAQIPAARDAFGALGRVRLVPGPEIARAHALEADVLLVRSVTRVDRALVGGTPVRFVGTATAGVDHVDARGLERLGIGWASAPGSNATAVAEWAVASLLALAADRGEGLAGRTLAVVGVGAVGRRVVVRAHALGMRTVLVDPPRADTAAARGDAHPFVPLAEALAQADVLTLHTPLVGHGPDATRGLLGADALARLRPGAWVVNASRGEAVDGAALLEAVRAGHVGGLALDVWPGEPLPDAPLAALADVATPHTAGYSLDGKLAGTAALARALRAWHAAETGGTLAAWSPPEAAGRLEVAAPAPPPATPEGDAAWLDALVRQALDVRTETARFRAGIPWGAPAAERAAAFAALRRTYPERREWARYCVRGAVPQALRAAVAGLGFRTEGGIPTRGTGETGLAPIRR